MKILILVGIWLVVFVSAFVLPRFIPATGDGFTRGLNRLPALAGLHCVGLFLALLTAGISYKSKANIAKWLLVTGFAPLTIDVLLIVLVVGGYIFAILSGIVARWYYG